MIPYIIQYDLCIQTQSYRDRCKCLKCSYEDSPKPCQCLRAHTRMSPADAPRAYWILCALWCTSRLRFCLNDQMEKVIVV